MTEPIAIIGSGCRFPGDADTPSKLWSLVHHPRDLSRKPSASRFNTDKFYHPVGTHHGTTNATKSYWLEDSNTSNVAQFDAGFFNIQPSEVEAMDPQQRLLMEVVYDGLCAAGQPMENLRGSDTAVYVGMMSDDWSTMLTRDWETLPRYTATGLERGIVANRLSFFFDWHGPSMTIDTACSSSLVALDLAVQVLRSGRSKVAVAAGTNLILSPAMYISESNLGMLSPNGRCAMWDVAADGYARGEGVAAVFLKTLSQAIADNDPIECLIRETAVNQDGRTTGLTMPSNLAQAALIRQCYAKAGLDPVNNLQDRPQFFHAHGTGTQAGDPQEAEAISTALFPAGSHAAKEADKLFVGSIKTVIGHTESTAGLASLISTSLALRHGIIPPNLHFENLSPKVTPFFKHLDIPTAPTAWPVRESELRRASVNSFGFGGTNAHCILEEYVPNALAIVSPAKTSIPSLLFAPLLFSAASEAALRVMLSQHLEYLKANPTVGLADFAYTLQHRRSTLPYRKAIAAQTVQDAIQALEALVNPPPSGAKDEADLGTRFGSPSHPAKIIGIFTGQGAQWPRMGARLVESSPFVQSRIAELDAALQNLPEGLDRPPWTLKDQLLADKETSRITEAALSQPLCTAVQIVLVDILRVAGVSFTAVVGHSSGEIGAAYAAGFVSAQDAIRIAYFRGLYAKLASSPNLHAPRGAMLAVGTSVGHAQVVCDETRFLGRLQVAAVNSSSSVTLSGDEDAVDEAEKVFKEQGIFARKLKVDTAYHSAHMASCARPYLSSLERCGIQQPSPECESPPTATIWYSSVYQGEAMTRARLTNQYWVDNMCEPVLFAEAVAHATQHFGTFDTALEVGPHPALKGPATANIREFPTEESIPYTGLLSRGQNDIEQLSAALGVVWSNLGHESVRFSAVETLLSGVERKTVLKDLPTYPFEHQRNYWTDSRLANHFKNRRGAVHTPNPVLGSPCTEATTPGEFQWRNILRPSEVPWLKGHQLQGQTVFPATGYVSMAVEAIKALALDTSSNTAISLFKLTDVEISRAITFNDDTASVETIFSVSSIETSTSGTVITASWACYSVADDGGSGNVFLLNAKGSALCRLSPPEAHTLPGKGNTEAYNLVSVEDDHFYANLSSVGYDYSPPFRGVSSIRRKSGCSMGTILDQSGSEWEDNLLIHPGMLDSALQTAFAAWSFPGDTKLWALHVPVSISSVTVNPYFTTVGNGGKQSALQYETFIRSNEPTKVVGDICLHTEDGTHAFLLFEGAALVPFSPATPKKDLPMFSHFQYRVASPDGQLAAAGETLSDYEVQMYKDVDRAAYWFVRNVSVSLPPDERDGLLPHFQKYLRWCDRMVEMVSSGAHPKVTAERNTDSSEDISRILARYEDRKDIRFVQVVGENLVPVIRAGTSMLEYMNQDGLLRAFYEENAICSGPTGRWLANLVSQISHRFPGLNILEVGAGTGATTSAVLRALDGAYASYTFTDISSGFFMAAEERFGQESSRMLFRTFDMEKNPSGQGFVEASYDVLVAVNVLHVSADIEVSLANIRRLLKPGGFLVVAELTSTDLLFSGMTVGTLPGWWIGADTGRPWGPLFSLGQWDAALKKTGFAGIDTVTPDISASLPMNVFVAQAVNDQVVQLRNPLAADLSSSVRTDALAIVGGNAPAVCELSKQISNILSHHFTNPECFNTVEDFASSDMVKSCEAASLPVTILSLTDLDSPYLENLTGDKFDALKGLFGAAGTLIWVTCGSRGDKPYSYMMMGITRTVKTENPNLNVQIFDLDSGSRDSHGENWGIQPDMATDLAEGLLRHHALRSWSADNNLLWTAEPEVFVSNGRHLITRLLPDVEKNERYNSRRRNVFTQASPLSETLQLVGVGQCEDRRLELQKPSPSRFANNIENQLASSGSRMIRITHSLLQNLAVCSAGFFRLCVGVDVNSNEVLLALAASSESPVQVPAQLCVPFPRNTSAASTLISVATNLIADGILSSTPTGSTLLVHEADLDLELAIRAKAESKNVNVVFTTANNMRKKNQGGCSSAVFVDPNCSRHFLQSMVPPSTAVFVWFSRGEASDVVGNAISECLLPNCLRIREEAVLSHQVNAVISGPQPQAMDNVQKMLQTALDSATSASSHVLESIALDDVSRHKAIDEPLAVVNWTVNQSLPVKVQPVDEGALFRSDRTYLFVGMASEIGQSLARWMVEHGARCVILTSRMPKVNPRFTEDMERQYGATITSMSLDVTSWESLWSVYNFITATLPPIAGIINGAMILEDELFANMTYEQFMRVTSPKVLGTRLLDELFHDDTSLDFFIVASSIASIIGWSGQSNYSAANEFMTSLVHKRRKRGVAGSTMSIPAVLGVGYAAHSETFDFDYFQSLGYINISEEDLHALFAEAILSGQPGQGPNVQVQVAMGVNFIPPDLYVKEVHRRDVKFSHFIQLEENGGGSEAQITKSAAVRVKVQLQTANSEEQAYTIIRDSFVAHLKRMLRFTGEDTMEDSLALVEQGVDSLVAVDIRSWFLKELEVDIPTLKILGGGSIAHLVQMAIAKIPDLLQNGPAAASSSEASEELRQSEPDLLPRGWDVRQTVEPQREGSPSSSASTGSSVVFTPHLPQTPIPSDHSDGGVNPPSDLAEQEEEVISKEAN